MFLTDKDLLEACQRGEASAWQALVERYQRLAYSIPRKAGLDGPECDDVFQHVMIALYENLGRIEQPERLAIWIVTTAKREAWRLAKKARRTQSLSADSENEDHALRDENPLPDEIAERLLEQHQVRTALAELDKRCRHLLRALYYLDTIPAYAELARTLGIPEGSIGPTRARCLEKLRRMMQLPAGK